MMIYILNALRYRRSTRRQLRTACIIRERKRGEGSRGEGVQDEGQGRESRVEGRLERRD